MQERHENSEDLVIIGIDVRETEKELAPYLERHGVTFPVALDEQGSLAQLFYVSGFPTSVFISPDGTLIGSVPGYIQSDQLDAYIEYARTYVPGESE